MKRRSLLSGLLICICLGLQAGQGGPDLYGYIWMDNVAPGGPVYEWVDIVYPEYLVTGLADDNVRGPFPLATTSSDDFHYYWYPVEQLWIGSNGYLSFSNINLASPFPFFPDSLDNKHNFIGALLSDLSFGGANNPGQCYLKVTYDSVIVSYIDVPFYSNNWPYWSGSNTFQVILNKTDHTITINYQSQSGTAYTSTDVRGGMENLTGTIGLQAFSAVYPTAGYTIRYYPPANPSYLVRDGAVKYNSVPQSRGMFLPLAAPFSLRSMIGNMGNLEIPPPFNVNGMVRDALNAVTYYDVYYFNDTLEVQQDSLITYPAAFVPAAAGTYAFTSRLYGVTGDAVAVNDSVIQELVVIDTSQQIYELGYCDDTPDLTGISWVDGTGGVGIYVEPLTYPVRINTVQFYLTSNINNAGCFVKIFDDDGPGGSAGSLLDSVSVAAPPGGAWTTVTFTDPIVLYDGGFFIGWEMNGLNITMGVDRTLPISHRCFEVISGAWSEYRDALTQDFMIRCSVEKTLVSDLGVTAVVNPQQGDTLTAATQVSCRVKNTGQSAVTAFQMQYGLNGQTLVTQPYSGPAVLPGDSILFTFLTPIQVTADQGLHLCVWPLLNNDANPSNDTSCIDIITQVTTGLHESAVQEGLSVYPNPASGQTYVQVSLPAGAHLGLRVYNALGACVGLIGEGVFDAGIHRFSFRGENLPAGIYTILMVVDARTKVVQRLQLL